MHNLLPQFAGRDLFLHKNFCFSRLLRLSADRELLHVRFVVDGGAHELVVNLHAHVGTCHLALGHLCVDECLRVGMLDAHTQHQRSAATVLCHLARTITITLHKRHQSCRGECRVVHGRAFRTDMTQVMAHTTAALHQLHLLLVDAQDGTIRVGIAIKANHEAVRERSHLIVIADSCHRAACGNNIFEVVQQIENLLGRQRVRILLLHTRNLVGNTPVHLFRRALVDVAERIFHGIFVQPHASSQLVTAKILQ